MLLENPLHGFEIEFRRQVEHREIFVVEILGLLRLVGLAAGQVVEQVDMRLHMAVEVHRHEGGELDEAGIDPPLRALEAQGHAADQVLLEPGDRLFLGEIVDLGRGDARVDRPGHQGNARRAAPGCCPRP